MLSRCILFFAQVMFVASAQPMHVSDNDAAEHRLSHHDVIRVPHPGLGLNYVALDVVVDAEGNVTTAKATGGPAELYDQAVSLVKYWKYKPFEREGTRVPAEFKEYVIILPPEKFPDSHVPFPKVRDLGKLKMTLERTLCYGSCPSYKVEISGDGTVTYDGDRFVAVKGIQRGHISHDDVMNLIDLFRAADYFSLPPEYKASVTDNPTIKTSISIDGKTKAVIDYAGELVGMPQSVNDLELGIDRIVNTARWVRGTIEPAKPN